MAGEEETKLYVAATKGDVTTFQDVLQEYPYLLDGALFAYSRNLLHIATIWEQVGIVEEVLRRNPKLAEDVESKNSSPLHIAEGKGNFQIVCMLLAVAPDMCWSVDGQGMNPIHIAAKNGNVDVLEHLLGVNPSPAMERLNCGGTVLNLCVKHGQLRSLQVLVEKFGDLVNAKDNNGESPLHMAVRCIQLEIVRYLIESTNVTVLTRNTTGYTPIGLLEEMPSNDATSEIKEILKKGMTLFRSLLGLNSRMPDNIMVVVALIASVAFSAIVNPPGSVWQEDSSTHKAGEAVMATNRPKIYKYFIGFNTGAFVASMVAMFTLTPPGASSFASLIVIFGFSAALVFAGLSYGASLMVILPNRVSQTINPILYAYVGITLPLLISLFLASFWNKRKQGH